MALTHTPEPELGRDCPEFSLLATDGKTYSRSDLTSAKVSIAMFICNHCPYVKAIEDRLIELGRRYQKSAPNDVRIFAICANDGERYPEDSFEELKSRADQKNYPFPYLYDESQDVARRFGAVCTPDFFVYDQSLKLAYRGRLDDSWKDAANVRSEDLRLAIDDLLAGRKVQRTQLASMGCSIKWKT
jgi:peroxiredoxin